MGVAHMVATFAGGLGFFLLGMKLMTEGLKLAAGGALERVLRRATETRLRALVAGTGITALVQSSSAVTVATLGFVNAGLLDLSAGAWVIFGSNVGTTTTGWLVSLTGLDLDIEALALPVVGFGTLLNLSGATKRRGAVGRAITGLGLFFVGLGVLSDAFGELATQTDLSALHTSGLLGGFVLLWVGAGLTAAMQSSSAAIAITLTAAGSGVVELPGAAAMVIGANLGTTSTAILAALKATPDAKRVAGAHVAFNLLAGLVAFALLPVLLRAVASTSAGSASIAATLALFHTTFNVLGLLVVWPLAGRLVRRLEGHFVTLEEEEGKPRYLDKTVLQIPQVGLRALQRETLRLAHLAGRIVGAGLDGRTEEREHLQAAFDRLLAAIANAVDQLDRAQLTEEVALGLRQIMRATRHYVIATEQASELTPPLPTSVSEAARWVIARLSSDTFDVEGAGEAFGALQERYNQAREELLERTTRGTDAAQDIVHQQLQLTEMRRAAKHLVRGARDLAPLISQTSG